LTSVSCTPRREYFQGVNYTRAGIEISSDILNCGCGTFRNLTERTVRLQSRFEDAVLGNDTLGPRQSRRYRFDWSGYELDDRYLVQVLWETGGKWEVVNELLGDVVTVDELATRIPCEAFEGLPPTPEDPSSCEYRTLSMSIVDLPLRFRALNHARRDPEADHRIAPDTSVNSSPRALKLPSEPEPPPVPIYQPGNRSPQQ